MASAPPSTGACASTSANTSASLRKPVVELLAMLLATARISSARPFIRVSPI